MVVWTKTIRKRPSLTAVQDNKRKKTNCRCGPTPCQRKSKCYVCIVDLFAVEQHPRVLVCNYWVENKTVDARVFRETGRLDWSALEYSHVH